MRGTKLKRRLEEEQIKEERNKGTKVDARRKY